jgi:hypothetical protein
MLNRSFDNTAEKMNILGQSAKVRRHMAMLTIVLMLMSPFVLFSTVLMVSSFFSAAPPEGSWEGIALIGSLGIPISMWVFGFFLLAKIRAGFTHSTRKRLFAFHVCLWAYCSIWLTVPVWLSDERSTLFELLPYQAISLVISVPSFVTMFTKPESEGV